MNIRPARPQDRGAIVDLWHRGWHDAHAGIVPKAVLAFRTVPHFELWLDSSPDRFHVAEGEGGVLGFVTVQGAELVKLYVSETARGTGVARSLLAHGEAELFQSGVREAVLFCTAGNARAERFYQREGWDLVATIPDTLWLPPGTPGVFIVSTHRYQKPRG